MIRAIADRLRSVTTTADLADRFGQAEALAVSAAGESRAPIDDLHAGALAGAGFRLRYQDILAGSPHAADGESAPT